MPYNAKTHAALIKALGIEALPEEEQAAVLERSAGLVYQAVVTRALEEMNDAALDAFEKLLEEDPVPESLLAFFQDTIPGFDVMIAQEAKNFVRLGNL